MIGIQEDLCFASQRLDGFLVYLDEQVEEGGYEKSCGLELLLLEAGVSSRHLVCSSASSCSCSWWLGILQEDVVVALCLVAVLVVVACAPRHGNADQMSCWACLSDFQSYHGPAKNDPMTRDVSLVKESSHDS